jgi:hypothetical protein
MKMSNSKKKMDVMVGPTKYGKKWVKITLKTGNMFMPSFEDLYRIVQAVAYCEQEKYPDGRGKSMVADFLRDCVYTPDFETLAKKYKIPVRCGEKVMNDNGAKHNPETFVK